MRLMKDNVERIAESEAQISKLKAAGYRPLEKSEVREKHLSRIRVK